MRERTAKLVALAKSGAPLAEIAHVLGYANPQVVSVTLARLRRGGKAGPIPKRRTGRPRDPNIPRTEAGEIVCATCAQPHTGRGVECKTCYMKEWRKSHPLTPAQRVKDNARSYARVYRNRGHLTVQGCEVCGAKAEMHHEDYSRPLHVRWLCRAHHMEEHAHGST